MFPKMTHLPKISSKNISSHVSCEKNQKKKQTLISLLLINKKTVAPEGRKRVSSCSPVAPLTALTPHATALSPTDSRRDALHGLRAPGPSTQGAKLTGFRCLFPHTPSPGQQHGHPLLPAELQPSAKGPQCPHLGLCKVLVSGQPPSAASGAHQVPPLLNCCRSYHLSPTFSHQQAPRGRDSSV